ncbi:hypothetical protein BC940DRAFT_314415 [Gongronella butleri]|nr:hypothetical protein BC940DRAFT_314415 [Gongronella butleri]
MLNKEALRTQASFAFSPSSGQVLPFATLREKLQGAWRQLDWPILKTIIKADLAVVIVFGLIVYDPIRERTSTAGILGCIAVEFIHPCKSLGFIAEDAIFGAFMCCIAAAYSILGTYCAFLVREPEATVHAQPAQCGILISFLAVGAFVLNYVRVKVDQANVGGMLSASIMCFSFLGAVLDPVWSPINVVIYLIPPLAGFLTIFLVFLILGPDNSTRFYVQDLVKTLEVFSDITRQQVQGFFQSHYQGIVKEVPAAPVPDTPAEIHNKIDSLLLALIHRKRTVCREISFNTVSPVDAKELTKLLKRLRVPLHGVAIGRVMASNLRKLDLIQRTMQPASAVTLHKSPMPCGSPLRNSASHMSHASSRSNSRSSTNSPPEPQADTSSAGNRANDGSAAPPGSITLLVPPLNKQPTPKSSSSPDLVPSSWYGDDDLEDDQQKQLEAQYQQQQHQHHLQQLQRLRHEPNANSATAREKLLHVQQLHQFPPCPSPSILVHEPSLASSHASTAPSTPRQSVTLEEGAATASIQHDEYMAVLQQSRATYIDLVSACSIAVDETIKRLRRMQNIDPRTQNKPFFVRFWRQYRGTPNTAIMYDHNVDPSLELLTAIQQFDAKRLMGLGLLYNRDKHPRRALLMILLFQFNLRTYAEILYTLSSLVYDMDQVRHQRRFWLPSVSLHKLFWKKRETAYDLDAPSALTQQQQSSTSNLQRTLTHHTVLLQSFIDVKHDQSPSPPPNDDKTKENNHNTAPTSTSCRFTDEEVNVAAPIPRPLHDDDDEDDENDENDDESEMDDRPRASRLYSLSYPVRGQVPCREETRKWFHQHYHEPSVDNGNVLQRYASATRRRISHPLTSTTTDQPRQQQQVPRRPPNRRRKTLPMLLKLNQWRQQFTRNTRKIIPKTFLDPYTYHDPDAGYPTTRSQRFFYWIWEFSRNYVYTSDTAFALRAAVLVVLLSLPGFLDQSVLWYTKARGQWAPVVALIWMGPSVGSSLFGTMVRTIGTFIGAVCGLLIWEISRGYLWAILVVMFIVNIPLYMIYTLSTFYRATGLFSLITTSLIVGYGYIFKVTGENGTVYEITYLRTATVLVGVFAAMLITIFPYAHTSRVEVRHHIARMLGDIGALYASFLGLLLKGSRYEYQLKETNQKLFKTFANSIRQHIKITRALMEQSRFEPTLRGPFPEKQYLKLLQVLDNILNIMLQMELALEKIDTRYRLNIVNVTWTERKDMIASILTALQVASNALVNKTPLPPYIIRPTKARRTLTDKVRHLPPFSIERLGEPEYTYYSTYLMNSEQLAVEVEVLVATVRDLVGPDSVSVYLEYVH